MENKRNFHHPWLILTAIVLVILVAGILVSNLVSYDLLSVEERAWLVDHPVVRLAPDPHFPPLEYFDDQGVYTGLVADYFKVIEQRLNIKIEYVRYDSWDEVLMAVREGEIDGITAAQITPERQAYLVYTSELMDIPNVIITRNDVKGELNFSEMSNMSVAVTRGYAAAEYIRANYPKINLHLTNNDFEALTSVSFKQADATVVNEAIASYLIDQHGISNLRIAGDSGKSNSLAIAVRREYPILRDILEKGLNSINIQERQDIYSGWVHLGSKYPPVFGRYFWVSFTIGGAVITLLLLFILLWNVTLHNRVRQRTDELKQELEVRRKAEKEIVEKTDELNRIFSLSLDLLSISNFEGQFIKLNPAWEWTLGYTSEELEGRLYMDFIHPDDLAGTGEMLDQIREGKDVIDFTNRFRSKDGSYRWIEWRFKPYQKNLVYAAARDITERRQNEEKIHELNTSLEQRVQERTAQLLNSNQELESFSYSVSHDLRAPLRSIDAYCKILQEEEGIKISAESQTNFSRVRLAVKHMSNLIDDLLRLSRITRSKMELEEMDLCNLAWKIFTDLRNEQPDRNIQLITPDNLVIYADKNLMSIALENLLRNAWKFTGKNPSGVIEVGKIFKDEKWVYFIRDNGAGFDMMYVDRLFRSFERLHSFQDYEGTGIGLAMVQRIIHRHGGRVWAEGEVDKGAVFYFELPS